MIFESVKQETNEEKAICEEIKYDTIYRYGLQSIFKVIHLVRMDLQNTKYKIPKYKFAIIYFGNCAFNISNKLKDILVISNFQMMQKRVM